MSDFDIRALLREVAKETGSLDAAVVASKAAAAVPDSELRDVLALALRDMARGVLAEHRPHGRTPTPTRMPMPTGTPNLFPTRQRHATTIGGRKGAEIRDAWQKVLEAPYLTADGQKKLGDFTYEDCHFVAARLNKQADEHAARARLFNELAASLTDHDTATIRELPAEVKMQLLGAAA